MRHILDRARLRRGLRLKRFARIERALSGRPGREVTKLRRMPKRLNGSLRLKRYLKIARAEA